VAVTKTQPPEAILQAYHAGHRIFGENKVQELVSKYELLPKEIEWHMIGHLQTNKVKFIVPFVHLIHSVDSLKLLQEIDKQAGKVGRKIKCLLQIHIAKEETKFGFSESEVVELLKSSEIQRLTNIQIDGLMGMATFTSDIGQIRREFRGLKQLFDQLNTPSLFNNSAMNELSIGMSSDYKIAIEEGSTIIRVGTAIFGERKIS
jgi:pyridoxal phosphate enzyme (YggS family)